MPNVLIPLRTTVSPSLSTILLPSTLNLPVFSTMLSVITATLEGSVASGGSVSSVSVGTVVSVGSVSVVIDGNVSGPRFVVQEQSKTTPVSPKTATPRKNLFISNILTKSIKNSKKSFLF